MRHVAIFDTTLRDGEQAPGFSMNVEDKLLLARQLERLNVDVIEAGFPIASDGDFEAVRKIADEIRGVSITGLARTNPGDIRRCWQALEGAAKPRIHTFLATSDIHLHHKLRVSRTEALDMAAAAVELARSLCDDVQFSAEDAGRTDPEYLYRAVAAVIEAGATVVNIPDTVGYCMPAEYGALIAGLGEVKGIEGVTVSTHCHDDLGLAVANSLAGVLNGARQVECAVNGIGERAGNAALEEVVMALHVRSDLLGLKTGVNTREIHRASQLLASVTGTDVQPNKAIVGRNAFAHEAGIHQDGVLKFVGTYEIMTPESVGVPENRLVLGKHSGRHALAARYRELGYDLSEEDLARAYMLFTKLADRKGTIYDDDLLTIVHVGLPTVPKTFALKHYRLVGQADAVCAVTVGLETEGALYTESATGDGPVDATVRAVNQIVGTNGRILEYSAKSVTHGSDAVGEVFVKVDFGGRRVTGRAASTDLNIGAALSYLDAINRATWLESRGGAAAGPGAAVREQNLGVAADPQRAP